MKYKIPSWTLAFIACLLWSTAFVGVKYAIGFADPIFVAGIRFFLAGIVLIPFAGKGYIKEFKKHFKVIVVVSFFQTFCVYMLYFLAMDRIKASTAAALIGLGPMIGALMGHFFITGENFTKKRVISFILGIVGVTLVSLSGGKGGAFPDIREIIGIVLFILNSVAGAISNVVVIRYKSSIKSSVLTSGQLTLGGVFLFIVSIFMYKEVNFIQPLNFYFALSWLVFVSAAGFSIWYYLLSKRKESLISMNIWKFIMPVAGGILGWIIMPEDSPSIKAIIGMIVVAFSIYIFYKENTSNR